MNKTNIINQNNCKTECILKEKKYYVKINLKKEGICIRKKNASLYSLVTFSLLTQ